MVDYYIIGKRLIAKERKRSNLHNLFPQFTQEMATKQLHNIYLVATAILDKLHEFHLANMLPFSTH